MANTNGELKIDKGIPIPEKFSRKTNAITMAAVGMDVGDSFITNHSQQSIYGFLKTAVRKGYKFTTQKIDEHSCRVWRTK